MMIDYLKNRAECVNAVAQFIYDEFVDKTNQVITLEFCREFFAKTASDHLPITFVAIEDGQCIGAVSLFENDLPEHPELTPWLASLVIHKEYRRQGIGEKLIRRVIEEGYRLGYSEIYLKTEKEAGYYQKRNWMLQFTAKTRRGKTYVLKYQILS